MTEALTDSNGLPVSALLGGALDQWGEPGYPARVVLLDGKDLRHIDRRFAGPQDFLCQCRQP